MNPLKVNIHISDTSLDNLEKALKRLSEIDRELQKIHPDVALSVEAELN